MNTENSDGVEKSTIPLTRKDIEQLLSTFEHASQLDLHLQNMQEINLSYMDLRGINLQGADLQGPICEEQISARQISMGQI